MNIILFFAIIFQLGNCFCMNSPITPNAGPYPDPKIESRDGSSIMHLIGESDDSEANLSDSSQGTGPDSSSDSKKEEKEEEEYKENPLSFLQQSPGDIDYETPMSYLPTGVINIQGITPLHTSSSGFGFHPILTSHPQNFLQLRNCPASFQSNQNQTFLSHSPFCVSSSKTGQGNCSGLLYSHGNESDSGTDNDTIMDAFLSINSKDAGRVRSIFYPPFSKDIHQGTTIEHIEKLDIKLNPIPENPISIGGGHFLPDGQEEIISIQAPCFLETPMLNFRATIDKANNQVIENSHGFKIGFWTITATDETKMAVENEIQKELESNFHVEKEYINNCLKDIELFFTKNWEYVKKLKKLQRTIAKKAFTKKTLTEEELSMNKEHWLGLLNARNCCGDAKRKTLQSNIDLLNKYILDKKSLSLKEINTVENNLLIKREGKGKDRKETRLNVQDVLNELLECKHFLECYHEAEKNNKIAGLDKEDIIAYALLCIRTNKEFNVKEILENTKEEKLALQNLINEDITKKLLFYLNNLIIPHYKVSTLFPDDKNMAPGIVQNLIQNYQFNFFHDGIDVDKEQMNIHKIQLNHDNYVFVKMHTKKVATASSDSLELHGCYPIFILDSIKLTLNNKTLQISENSNSQSPNIEIPYCNYSQKNQFKRPIIGIKTFRREEFVAHCHKCLIKKEKKQSCIFYKTLPSETRNLIRLSTKRFLLEVMKNVFVLLKEEAPRSTYSD